MDYIGGKHDRLLALYNNLIEGGRLNVKNAAEYYGVSTKTIRRDIENIRGFLDEKSITSGIEQRVVYDRAEDNYRLDGNEKMSGKEIFALCKVMLESRAFCKSEFLPIMDKIIDRCVYEKESAHIKDMISNEKYHYCEPQHRKKLVDAIWDLSYAVQKHCQIKIKYERLTAPKYKERVVNPVGIMFSEHYFYLAAFIPEKNTKNPTIYRIDRIAEYKILKEKFKIPYTSRFEEGEFRKRIQFMYGGELLKIEFNYRGESPEAIMDRLPTAKIIDNRDGIYHFRAEVFGRGVKPWILSQTDRIEVLSPKDLRDEIKTLISDMLNVYE